MQTLQQVIPMKNDHMVCVQQLLIGVKFLAYSIGEPSQSVRIINLSKGIPTKPGYKELFILILQKTSNNN